MRFATLSIALAALFAGGCFQLAAQSKCNDRKKKLEEEISMMRASPQRSARVAGRWACVSSAYPNDREYWRISQKGNSVRVIANVKGRNMVMKGGVSRERLVWAGKGTNAGSFVIEGDALVGEHIHVGGISCEQIEFTCTRI